MDFVELLIGIAEIATALAGFTGVVVVFGSRSEGTWHPGDRLRLGFLLEASLTAGGFSLLALILLNATGDNPLTWATSSSIWAVFMVYSLYSSRKRIRADFDAHGDVDRVANRFVAGLFIVLIVVQLVNAVWWQQFAPFLAALSLNLGGAAMQFTRLIRTAFHN
ncbi:MAG: hypothetical protein V3U43_01035 [Pseudomonadales bacterium]